MINRFLASLCFLSATVTGIGIASEHFSVINKILPKVLMALLGIFFLLPVAIIAKFVNLIFLSKSQPEEES
jgi:cytochrome b subunit of formate dehydrogenase